jgi:hypothetical protein
MPFGDARIGSWRFRRGLGSIALLLAAVTWVGSAAASASHDAAVKIVSQIQRADYEGDRAALKRLFGELAPFADDKEIGSRVRYWRGFAL